MKQRICSLLIDATKDKRGSKASLTSLVKEGWTPVMDVMPTRFKGPSTKENWPLIGRHV